MRSLRNDSGFKSGFTLIELVVSIGIFTVILVTIANLFVTGFRLNQEVSVREQLYSDARFLLSRIAREVRASTIDYEEYFNRVVMEAAVGGSGTNYGDNYGLYRRQFYYPGITEGVLDDYGARCTNGAVWTPGVNCAINKETRDQHTGQNPYRGHIADSPDNIRGANAFCGFIDGAGNPSESARPIGCDASGALHFIQNELYLISADGEEKTLFIREQISDPGETSVYALSMVKMEGRDENGDGAPEIFECGNDFFCNGGRNTPSAADAATLETEGNQNFIPISPNRLNIIDIVFYIAPVESPFYAFAESDLLVRHLPFITIIMTVEPNRDIAGANTGNFRITLQETVSTSLLRAPEAPLVSL